MPKRKKLLMPAKAKAPISNTSSARIKLTLQAQKLKCAQLQREIDNMKAELLKSSVMIDSDLSRDLIGILDESSTEMTPFMKLFWEQQKSFLLQTEKASDTTQ